MKIVSKATKIATKTTFLGCVFTGLFSCYHGNEFIYTDPDLQLHEYEMVAKLQNKSGRKVKKVKTEGLSVIDTVYAPDEPKAIEDKIVSINVTEEIPIVDVIMELARMSGTDIQIDPTIVGGVNLNLRDKPLRYVFNRICGLTDTRYREKYGIVVFERDIPYAVSYNLDFLDLSRSSTANITMNTSGLSSTKSTGGGQTTVSTTSSDTFWDDVVADIKQIITTTEDTHRIYTKTAEKIQNISRTDKKRKESDQKQINGELDLDKNEQTIAENEKLTSVNDAVGGSYTSSLTEKIKVNRRAGMITVTCGTKSHRLIEQYIEKLKRKVSSQVLIEMRFLEINLSKNYQAGIDWNNVNLLGFAKSSSTFLPSAMASGIFSLTSNKGINSTAKLLEKFGSTRTLSNPRITAMNNQPALMTFATNKVYFKVKAENTTSSSTVGNIINTNINADAQTMPLGIIMSVLPSIDLEKRTITLSIRPTISKQDGYVEDPTTYTNYKTDDSGNVTPTTAKVGNQIPVAQIREMDTILKLKDGQTAIIGGFTERNSSISENGVPGARAIPILGNAFEYKDREANSRETVILVKATIVDNGKKMSDYDKDFYETFSDDPRMNDVLD